MLAPGVFVKPNRNVPSGKILESVRKVGCGTGIPVPGSYSSALERYPLFPPAARTFPLASKVVLWSERLVIMLPVDDQTPFTGSYSSALENGKAQESWP